MKFFIDTANVDEIRKANDMGIICGVTTNPSLIAKEGRVMGGLRSVSSPTRVMTTTAESRMMKARVRDFRFMREEG